jgi:hypothetical protein
VGDPPGAFGSKNSDQVPVLFCPVPDQFFLLVFLVLNPAIKKKGTQWGDPPGLLHRKTVIKSRGPET